MTSFELPPLFEKRGGLKNSPGISPLLKKEESKKSLPHSPLFTKEGPGELFIGCLAYVHLSNILLNIH
jgi:hypothetical protein